MVNKKSNTLADMQSDSLTTCKHCQGKSHGPDSKRTRKLLCPAWGFRCTRCLRMGHYPNTCYECAYCASWGHNSQKCEACQRERVTEEKFYKLVFEKVARLTRCQKERLLQKSASELGTFLLSAWAPTSGIQVSKGIILELGDVMLAALASHKPVSHHLLETILLQR